MPMDKLLRELKTSQPPTDIVIFLPLIQKWFDEEEAWVMLGDLVNCLREYSLKGLSHGDIQPHNIFVIEDCEVSKKIKILDSCMLNEAECGYDRMRNDTEYAAALSPQAMFC
jgi:hypothetical protein